MKKTVTLLLLLAFLIGTGFVLARHYARMKADLYMHSIIARGWHVEFGRFGVGGGTCGWFFEYWNDDTGNCFAPYATVTWYGKVMPQKSSDPQWYAQRYDDFFETSKLQTPTDRSEKSNAMNQ